jgi:XTP/dITP diphosphohydrolase
VNLYFVTLNADKARELQAHFAHSQVEIVQDGFRIREVLDLDLEVIAREKTLSAYRHLSRPCAVEHGGLFIRSLDGFPSGLTKEVWDKLGGRICDLLPPDGDRSVVARSIVGYCDGRRILLHNGETSGTLAIRPAGEGGFGWDPIFVPDGSDKTFAQMSAEEKAAFSPVMKAWTKLRESLVPG